MSDIELILTALMAGAAAGTTAGVTAVAQSAVVDTYTGLRNLLRRVLTGQGRSGEVLDTVEAEPGAWQTDLGDALTGAHADQDQQVLAAARAVLAAADPAGTAAGKYTITVSDSTSAQVGDHTVHVDTNYGNTAGTMAGPVTVSYGGLVANPPTRPGV
ncbi:hypothetical protein [Dactylosporangium matsuzakiense]|uniref:Uncharacterized protein n=1 Tax=Dactylosporangium matsuzakiense TaxID=53360 RepID=A0A9W6KHE4_9ACTN|nr:hypothetical protein [Dactylosporangium matsuzakiense]UWZ45675.1 hypothetical protein Dmats_03915 [Dactylosporangium matsuzakiense]GLL00306.1 hypothetical protein GCM10017581_020460 [Dactylosporangium matsuzakiense]